MCFWVDPTRSMDQDYAIYLVDREVEHRDYSKGERMLVELAFLNCVVALIPVQPGGCPLHGENLGPQDPNSERYDFYTRSLLGRDILPPHYHRTGMSVA